MSWSTQNKATTGREAVRKRSQRIRDLVIFAMLGTLMFCSQIVMQSLPNIHIVGMLTIAFTISFRVKALIPIYIYVFIYGIYSGFDIWWYAYLYIWAILWGLTMLIPKKLPRRISVFIYPIICSIHGFSFGILYAPVWALVNRFNFTQTLISLAQGIPFDITHGVSNIIMGLMALPLSELIDKLYKMNHR